MKYVMTSKNHIVANYLKRISPEELAKMFHGTYERLAIEHEYRTREESRTNWENLPEQNKQLMMATCKEIIDMLVIGEIGDEIGMP